MNSTQTDSNRYLLDGTDPDEKPKRRSYRHLEEAKLCDDYSELRRMSDRERMHYASTPGGSKRTSISGGR